LKNVLCFHFFLLFSFSKMDEDDNDFHDMLKTAAISPPQATPFLTPPHNLERPEGAIEIPQVSS
jgi:hypothetical protein